MRLDVLRRLWERLRSGANREATLNSESFTDSEAAVGRMILPLLDDLASAERVITEMASHARALEVVLNLLPVAALVIDDRGRPLTSNTAARALFGGSGMPHRVVDIAALAVRSGSEHRAFVLANADGGGLTLRIVPADLEPEAPNAPVHVVLLVPPDGSVNIAGDMLTARFGLTPAQLKVVSHVSCGMTNREVAEQLNLSIETVRKHLAAVFSKTGTKNRAGLVALAFGARYGQRPGTELTH